MPRLRVALAQINTVVGDLDGNVERIITAARNAAAAGAHVMAAPEMAITGYPCEDLVLRPSFITAAADAASKLADRLAGEGLGELAVVTGSLSASPHPAPRVGRPAGEPQNVALVMHAGEVRARYAKHHLPNYGVFDEFRYFVPGDQLEIVRLGSVDLALTICEDMWQDGGPFSILGSVGADLIVCINASPYERSKDDFRHDLALRRSREAGAPIAFVNAIGGQDELVFDGDSFFVDPQGNTLARSPQFVEDLLVFDFDLPSAESATSGETTLDARDGTRMSVHRTDLGPLADASGQAPTATVAPPLDDCEELWRALVLATRDYVVKNRFRSVIIGLSGGIDSAVVAAIAFDALGADAVHVVGMPSRHSSSGSVTDAAELAQRLGLHWSIVEIAAMVEAYEHQLEASGGLHGLAAENLQARVRGTLLMALSNEHGHLVLTTGNKSELATGFSTLYGDSAGGFAPIKDVTKSLVWDLARWRNADARRHHTVEPIPQAIIDKPPSAELAPGQVDEDRLPAYEILDKLLEDYVVRDLGREQLVAAGHDPQIVDDVMRLVDLAEYKRRQYPPGPKISPRNFGRDRRLPITSRWREDVDVRLPR